jgi:hypothetical protein
MTRDQKFEAAMDAFDKALGALVDGALSAAETQGYLGCDIFSTISQALAYRSGQIEGFHMDYDAKVAGVKQLAADMITVGIEGALKNIAGDALNGMDESLKHLGHMNPNGAEVKSEATEIIAATADGKGKTYH